MPNDLPDSHFVEATLVPKPVEVTIPWMEDVEAFISTLAYSE